MIYLDSAAVVKLVRFEAESAIEAFVTYDKRLLAAGCSLGLPTSSPGATEPQ